MNACPNCGAELKFDIQSQKLACPYCGAKINAASYTEFGAAAEESHVSLAEAAAAEEGMAQDVLHASQVVNTVQSGAGQPAQNGPAGPGSGMLGPSGGNLGPSGSFASSGAAGSSFMSQGSGVSGSFASQAGATPSGAGFAGQGNSTIGVSDSFASQAGMAPVGGGFMQQGQGGALGGSTNFAAPGSGTATAAQTMATAAAGAAAAGPAGAAAFLGGIASAESASIGGGAQPQPMNQAAFGFTQQAGGNLQQGTGSPQQGSGFAGAFVDPNYDPTANYQELEVIAYSCPQCGGSIYSTDESVNGFCSFCGSNITLQSRMARMKYPKFVIPFRVTKNACKQYYLNHVKKAFFAPKELKNPEYLEHFRGIYMPYWGYDVMLYGNVNLQGTRSYSRGDYLITEHYVCTGLVDAYYKGLSYDASSSFDDHFSEQIAPYDAHAMIEFSPAYLSGFYADLQDVSYHLYEQDAIDFGRKRIMEGICKSGAYPGISFSEKQEQLIHPTIDARNDGVYTAFFPVWFLSYRNKDRVAYAVVNGQTGKLVSDLPVDKKKFILSALVISIPIFFLLMGMPTLMPAKTLLLAELISVLAVFRLVSTVKKVYRRDQHLDDRGYLSKYDRNNLGQRKKGLNVLMENKYTTKKQTTKTESKMKGLFGLLWFTFFVLPMMGMLLNFMEDFFGGGESVLGSPFGRAVATLVMAVVLVVVNCSGGKVAKQMQGKGTGGLLAGIWTIFGVCLLSGVVILLDPVSNLPYYICILILFAGTLIAQIMALDQYNLLTTRPLPQLNRKGGDDSAQD